MLAAHRLWLAPRLQVPVEAVVAARRHCPRRPP